MEMVHDCIVEPICETPATQGTSLSSDKGKVGQYSIEFTNAKIVGPEGYETAVAVQAYAVTDATGDGLTASKQNLFDSLNLGSTAVQQNVLGFHCDRQYDDKNLKVTQKMKREYKLSGWFNTQSDVAHLVESAAKLCREASILAQNIITSNKTITNIFAHSVKKTTSLKSYGYSYFYLTPKPYSDTKFIAHLSASFRANIRNQCSIQHLLSSNCSTTNKEGINNIYHSNINR